MSQKFADRFRAKRTELAVSQQAMAAKLGVSLATIQNYEAGKMPSAENLVAISQTFGCTTDWLLMGDGGYGCPKSLTNSVKEAAQADYGLILIKKVSARLSAGGGSFETEDNVTGLYAFREDWIRSKGRPDSLVLMDVSGESMHPLIENSDTVLINTAKNALIDGKIYAVAVEEQVFVKEYLREVSVHLFRSVNERYPVLRIDPQDESINWKVIGQVIWVCRELF